MPPSGTMYPNERSLPSLMPVLKTLVEPEIKTRFRNIAKARGLSESELLRAVVLAATDQSKDTDQPIQPDAEKAESDRMTVRMPRFLMEATKVRAKAKGMAPSRWVTALVQSNLTGKPVMSNAELEGLQASGRELVAIGRNINQIAKSINQANVIHPGAFEKEWLPLIKLTELSQAITENRAAIRALVRASQNAWKAD